MITEAAQDDDWSWLDDEAPEWVQPPTVDITRPSIARIYDYLLGGKDNFAADRTAADLLLSVAPDVTAAARANREYVVRAVHTMAVAGIDQFLDLGTGIPTSPNVHEVARTVHPGAAVVYIDNDPVVVAHSRALLEEDRRLLTLHLDLRDPLSVLGDPQVQRLLDLNRPVGLLMGAVLHYVDLAAAPLVVSRYVRNLVPGSQLLITVACGDGADAAITRAAQRAFGGAQAPYVSRTREQVEQLFESTRLPAAGLDIVYLGERGGSVLGGIAVT